MGRYLVQRMLLMLPTLFLISVVTFVIIQLPPGDYLTTLISDLEASGERADLQKVEFLRQQFGLDQPLWKQYWLWVSGLVQGDMGYSFEYDRPVTEIIGERLLLTFVVSFGSILFTWLMAFPIGVYSATHQYSWADHGLTLLGFLGLATPNFLLALILMFVSFTYFGTSVGGLFSPDMQNAAWSWARAWDLLEHLWIPVIVIGTSGTAAMIRRLRANLLDELRRPYVVTARAKGLAPRRILLKYPLRIALNPFIGDIGNLLPQVISGAIIVSIVLSLPTTGPILLRALRSQDMYLAGSFLMLLATLSVIGVFLSDLALAALDPRIRQGGGQPGEPTVGHQPPPVAKAGGRPNKLVRHGGPSVSVVPAAATLPVVAERLHPSEQERYYFASQWQLIWWRLRRHRFAMVSLWFLVALYATIPFVEFLAPYELRSRHSNNVFCPPQRVHLFHEGRLVGPFVYGQFLTVNMGNLKREYRDDRSRLYRLRLFAVGEPYRMWGVWRTERHLFGVEEGGTMFLLGTDRLGRDMLSRIIHGARISLTVGLLGISVSFVLALVFGGLSGYYGGTIDIVIQRLIEVIRAFPELPLWMALSAALPPRWDPILVYVGITVILGVLEWTGLARSVRGKLLAVREEDFATAAVLMGGSPPYVIRRHLLPAFTSHLIVSATLSIPNMILGETALSFLGLGLRPPITSWGVLLSEAQNMNAVALYPWLLTPVVMVVLTVLAFNFLGDGLRDAADPYA